MSDNQDPLNQLWQKQSTDKPDINAISKTWRKMKIKQKLYALADLFGVVFPVAFLYLNSEKLDRYTFFYFIVMIVLICPFVAYLFWLRRFSMGWSSQNTDQHIQNLKKQLKNNIKIAWLTKHSCWVTLVMNAAYILGLFYYEVFPVDRLISKALAAAGMLIVILPALWIWASRREQKFKSELAKLKVVFS